MLLNPKLSRSQTEGNIECITDQLTQYEGLLTNIRNDLFDSTTNQLILPLQTA